MNTNDLYVRTVHAAMARPIQGNTSDALQRFLTLNAAYFLGEWLPPRSHTRLVGRLATQLDGLADLSLPSDETAALQLAQHAWELKAELGPTPWTQRIITLTAGLVLVGPEDWDARVRDAIHLLQANGNGHPLLRAHARRRLWQLTQSETAPLEAAAISGWSLRYARRATRTEGQAIQIAEALLAELAYGNLTPRPPSLAGKGVPGRGLGCHLKRSRPAGRCSFTHRLARHPLPCEGRGPGG